MKVLELYCIINIFCIFQLERHWTLYFYSFFLSYYIINYSFQVIYKKKLNFVQNVNSCKCRKYNLGIEDLNYPSQSAIKVRRFL